MLSKFSFKSTALAFILVSFGLIFIPSAMAQAKKESKDVKAAEKNAAEELKKAKELEEAKAKEMEAAKKAKELEEAKTVLGYIKQKFSFNYHGEFYFQRKDKTSANKDDHDLQDASQLHNPTVTYRFYPNWRFLVTSEFKYTDKNPKGAYPNRHFRSLVLLTRENVLTEKEHGVKMDLGIGRRIFDRVGAPSSYGNSRASVNLAKKFGKHSGGLFAQYLANDPAKGKITSTTWKHSIELIPSFSYQITDKLSYFFNDDFIINTSWHNDNKNDLSISHDMNVGVLSYQFNDKNSSYFQLKYLHFEDFSDAYQSQTDYFAYYIGHSYSISSNATITPEVGSNLFEARDNRFLSKQLKYPEFAVYFDYAL